MINDLELKDIPFVDGLPDEGQSRIRWIRDGDCLSGAKTKNGNEGYLNEAGVSIQKNIVLLNENADTTKNSINKVIASVNNINEALELSSNTEAVKQIGVNKENIEILQIHVQNAENDIGVLQTNTDFIIEDVGPYDASADSVYRTVRDNIVWIKREMGQYAGQDINGLSVLGNESKGMKRRIMSNTSELVKQEVRIKTLEDNYQNSDIGSLTIEVNKIRKEVGLSTAATSESLYIRTSALETKALANTSSITNIETAIGFSGSTSITERVRVNTDEIGVLKSQVNTPITGILPRLTQIETRLGSDSVPASISGKVFILRKDLDALTVVVGSDTSSGLRGDVAWLNQRVGIVPVGQQPAPDTAFGQINSISAILDDNASAVQDLQVEIGNNNEGLKGQVIRLRTIIDGTNPNGITVEERGLLNTVKAHDVTIKTLVPDAPNDGKAYVRKNREWVDITTL